MAQPAEVSTRDNEALRKRARFSEDAADDVLARSGSGDSLDVLARSGSGDSLDAADDVLARSGSGDSLDVLITAMPLRPRGRDSSGGGNGASDDEDLADMQEAIHTNCQVHECECRQWVQALQAMVKRAELSVAETSSKAMAAMVSAMIHHMKNDLRTRENETLQQALSQNTFSQIMFDANPYGQAEREQTVLVHAYPGKLETMQTTATGQMFLSNSTVAGDVVMHLLASFFGEEADPELWAHVDPFKTIVHLVNQHAQALKHSGIVTLIFMNEQADQFDNFRRAGGGANKCGSAVLLFKDYHASSETPERGICIVQFHFVTGVIMKVCTGPGFAS
jgi:hypothetical protein